MTEHFSKTEWAHMNAAIHEATGKEYTQEQLEEIFKQLPVDFQTHAFEWSMADKTWKNKITNHFKEKNLK